MNATTSPTRRSVLLGMGALSLLPFRRGVHAKRSDPRMGFLGIGPESENHRLDHVQAKLVDFGQRYGFETVAIDTQSLERESLDDYSGFFVYGAGLVSLATPVAHLSDKAVKSLVRAVKKGAGLVALHCAASAVPSKGPRQRNQGIRNDWVDVLGGEAMALGDRQPGRVRMADQSLPGMTQLRKGFEVEDRWLAMKNFDPEMHVIMAQETEDMEGGLYRRPSYPITWLRYHGKGRVFYTTMGYETAVWDTDAMRRCVVGGALWVLRDTEADVSANLMRVTPMAIQGHYPL